MTNFLIRKAGQDPFDIPKNQVVPAIKSGKLLANDEISSDGKSWIWLSRHKQLGALFNQGEPPPPPKARPKVMSEAVFYSSDRINCPKCGFEQDRGDTCESCNVLFAKYWEARKARAEKKINRTMEPELESEESGGVFHKLWSGKYPIWKTFWLFGVVYPMCILVPIQLIFAWKMQGIVEGTMNQTHIPDERMADVMGRMVAEMQTYLMVFAVVMLVHMVYAFILNVGLWRSANNYTGDSIWRILSRIVVVLYFVFLPFSAYGVYKFSTGFENEFRAFENQFQQMQESQKSNPR